jgi:hypothetical protein
MSITEIKVGELMPSCHSVMNFLSAFETIKGYYSSCDKEIIKVIFCKDMKNNITSFVKISYQLLDDKFIEIQKHVFSNGLWLIDDDFRFKNLCKDGIDSTIMNVVDINVELNLAKVIMKDMDSESETTFIVKGSLMTVYSCGSS